MNNCATCTNWNGESETSLMECYSRVLAAVSPLFVWREPQNAERAIDGFAGFVRGDSEKIHLPEDMANLAEVRFFLESGVIHLLETNLKTLWSIWAEAENTPEWAGNAFQSLGCKHSDLTGERFSCAHETRKVLLRYVACKEGKVLQKTVACKEGKVSRGLGHTDVSEKLEAIYYYADGKLRWWRLKYE